MFYCLTEDGFPMFFMSMLSEYRTTSTPNGRMPPKIPATGMRLYVGEYSLSISGILLMGTGKLTGADFSRKASGAGMGVLDYGLPLVFSHYSDSGPVCRHVAVKTLMGPDVVVVDLHPPEYGRIVPLNPTDHLLAGPVCCR